MPKFVFFPYLEKPLLDGTLDLIDFSAIFCSEFYKFTFHLFCVLIFLVKSEVFLTQNNFFFVTHHSNKAWFKNKMGSSFHKKTLCLRNHSKTGRQSTKTDPYFYGLQKTWLQPKFEVSNSRNQFLGILVPGFYMKCAIFEFKCQVRSNLTLSF